MPASEERRRVYDAAVAAFARELCKAVPADPQIPDLEKKGFERVLYLHMASLAAVDGRSIGSAAEALAQTLRHERQFWRQQVEEMRLDGPLTESVQGAFGRAVAVLTLVGGAATEPQARVLLNRVLNEFPTRPDLKEAILDRLRNMYGGSGDGRFVDPLQPDILGEELVAETLRRDPHLLEKLLDGTTTGEGRALTVLTCLAQRRPEAEKWLQVAFRTRLDLLAETALDVAVETGDPIGLVLAREIEEHASEELAERLMERCQEGRYLHSVPLWEVGLAATAKKRDLFAGRRHPPLLDPEAVSSERARLANNLGARLSNLGRHEEALKATTEAVASYRDLVDQRPNAFLPDLAGSLANLGKILNDLGCRDEALKAIVEAVAGYRDLAGQRPAAFLPDLAKSLNSLGNFLRDLGRREEALMVTGEAVATYRNLADWRPDAFLPDLARSLNNLGVMLRDLARHEEALKVIEEAVATYRNFTGRWPHAFLLEKAASLRSLGTILSDLDRSEKSLKAIEEAVAGYRDLASRRHDAFLPDLATSLNNLGLILSNLTRREEALKAAEEAVRTLAPFFLRHPSAYGSWMQLMVRNYRKLCTETDQVPDDVLLRPIVEVLTVGDQAESP